MRDAERADCGVVEGGARTALELFLSAGGDFRHLDHLLGLEGAAGHQMHGLAGVAERHFRIVHRRGFGRHVLRADGAVVDVDVVERVHHAQDVDGVLLDGGTAFAGFKVMGEDAFAEVGGIHLILRHVDVVVGRPAAMDELGGGPLPARFPQACAGNGCSRPRLPSSRGRAGLRAPFRCRSTRPGRAGLLGMPHGSFRSPFRGGSSGRRRLPPSDWNVPIFSYKPLWVC